MPPAAVEKRRGEEVTPAERVQALALLWGERTLSEAAARVGVDAEALRRDLAQSGVALCAECEALGCECEKGAVGAGAQESSWVRAWERALECEFESRERASLRALARALAREGVEAS